jgi:hypothetical protein
VSPEITIFEPMPEPGEKHLHLRDGRVLGFVENDEGVVERAAAHVGQRYHLDDILLREPLEDVEVHHFAERVEQRPQVGIDLGLEITGQEAEALARLDGRPHEHDLAHLFSPQGDHGHCHGEKCLAAAGRAGAEHDVVVADRPHVGRLTFRPRHELSAGLLNLDRRHVVPAASSPVATAIELRDSWSGSTAPSSRAIRSSCLEDRSAARATADSSPSMRMESSRADTFRHRARRGCGEDAGHADRTRPRAVSSRPPRSSCASSEPATHEASTVSRGGDGPEETEVYPPTDAMRWQSIEPPSPPARDPGIPA